MFNLSTLIHEKLESAGIPINGVSYNSKEEPYIRVDFKEEVTEEQKTQAQVIVDDCLTNQDQYAQEWEDEEAKKITPEKVQPLVDLLISKGILTEEEITNL